jgi:predicted GIY-YIG superfamily endonuclease
VDSLPWHVYILLCVDGFLYVGMTSDLERRIGEHFSGRGGALHQDMRAREGVMDGSTHRSIRRRKTGTSTERLDPPQEIGFDRW